jgi:hypothetical protein
MVESSKSMGSGDTQASLCIDLSHNTHSRLRSEYPPNDANTCLNTDALMAVLSHFLYETSFQVHALDVKYN